MEKKMKFALFGNTYQPRKSSTIQKLLTLLNARKAELAIDQEFYQFLTRNMIADIKPSSIIKDNNFDADIVICMGGDGTFLKAASRVGNKQIPIVGINMGHLGFLADISSEEIEALIETLYTSQYIIEHRNVLEVKFQECGKEVSPIDCPFALNDVAVLKHDSSSMISIRTEINGAHLNTYQADGIVIATPTGSTAYNLSVGGPILEPTSHTIGITAVAPHSLYVRPVVLCDDCNIHLQITSRSHNFLVAIDGRSYSFPEKMELQIQKAAHEVLVIKRQNRTFFQTLREKMMWGADNRD